MLSGQQPFLSKLLFKVLSLPEASEVDFETKRLRMFSFAFGSIATPSSKAWDAQVRATHGGRAVKRKRAVRSRRAGREEVPTWKHSKELRQCSRIA